MIGNADLARLFLERGVSVDDADADSNTMLGRIQRIELGWSLHLLGEGRGQRAGVSELASAVKGLVL